jgi:hypothetical protein
LDNKSRMMREYQVRFRERLGTKLPLPTRPFINSKICLPKPATGNTYKENENTSNVPNAPQIIFSGKGTFLGKQDKKQRGAIKTRGFWR